MTALLCQWVVPSAVWVWLLCLAVLAAVIVFYVRRVATLRQSLRLQGETIAAMHHGPQQIFSLLDRLIEFRQGSPSVQAALELPGLTLVRSQLYVMYPSARKD